MQLPRRGSFMRILRMAAASGSRREQAGPRAGALSFCGSEAQSSESALRFGASESRPLRGAGESGHRGVAVDAVLAS